jgi:hypothetical protein
MIEDIEYLKDGEFIGSSGWRPPLSYKGVGLCMGLISIVREEKTLSEVLNNFSKRSIRDQDICK